VRLVVISCDNLQVSKKTETKKDNRMDISGVFAIQCSHVVVHSLVNLISGEEYVLI
jgi:hypothetical protein